ncbi:hypothetical protein ACJ41O_007707 [Fusarium nematophilum]
MVFDGIGPINVGPASAANVQRLPGDEYGALCHDDRPLSTRLPNEIVQQIYSLLAPEDYDAARYTCRSWFFASLERSLLVKILKRGGWWSSLQQIFNPLSVTRLININQERIMSKWISRECDLSSPKRSAFEQVGLTDFSGLVPGSTADGLHGTLVFTTSLCGRFLMVTHGRSLYVYELNHVCFNRRSSCGDSMQLNSDEATGNSSDPPSTVDADKQMIVFYTIPPDMFLVISRGRSLHSSIRTAEDMEMDGLSGWVDWRPEGSYRDVGFSDDRFSEGRTYPLEIRGQPVAICSNLVELALDSGPDMVLWAFSAQGWARTWAMHAGREDAFNHTVVQQDGSLRQVDLEGDYAMAEVETAAGVSATDARGSHVFDASGPRLISGLQGEGMGGTVSVDLVEEVNGIARMDVELR